MEQKNKNIYELTFNLVKKTLNDIYNDLEQYILFVRGEVKNYVFSFKNFNKLKLLIDYIDKINKLEKFDNKHVIDGYLADNLEGFVQILLDYKKILNKEISSTDYIYKLMYKCGDLSDTIISSNEYDDFIKKNKNKYIKDDRNEILLNKIIDLSKLSGKTSTNVNIESKFTFQPYIQIFGVIAYILLAVSLLTIVYFEVSKIINLSKEISSVPTVSIKDDEYQAYRDKISEITDKYEIEMKTNNTYKLANKVKNYSFRFVLVYFILGRIITIIFKSKANKGSIHHKYVLALMSVDFSINLFLVSYNTCKKLLLECAEEGHKKALIKLGDYYASGFIKDLSVESGIEKAKEFYSMAFPDSTAVKKYNNLNKR